MIELKDVSLGYNHRAVLNNINLEAVPGKMLGLIGPNGSGKSTLIKGMTRVINLFSGHIFIDGHEIASMKREELAKFVAVVPQNPVLPEAFTAFEMVLMGRTPHLGLLRYEGGKDIAIVWQAMKMTQAEFLAERRVGELSGGEKQRLVIARALTQQSEVLLLDEPTAQLDINNQIEILDLIKRLSLEHSLTVIVALHDLNLAAQYCDWLVMLKEGKIYTEGIPQDVLVPHNIKDVYGAEVSVLPHPVNGLPVTLITSSEGNKEKDYIRY
ncbi:MAG: ABC transporter ATP-binding protein [Chloroflexota bacterium]|nr:ABC transporter ATP-binding protein [Chloroflexota bacterium]